MNLLREENQIYKQQLNHIERQDEDLINVIGEGNQQLIDLYEIKYRQEIE